MEGGDPFGAPPADDAPIVLDAPAPDPPVVVEDAPIAMPPAPVPVPE
ncbi:hypothetical protein TrRE_jg2339, partial [Triparma retinervis]